MEQPIPWLLPLPALPWCFRPSPSASIALISHHPASIASIHLRIHRTFSPCPSSGPSVVPSSASLGSLPACLPAPSSLHTQEFSHCDHCGSALQIQLQAASQPHHCLYSFFLLASAAFSLVKSGSGIQLDVLPSTLTAAGWCSHGQCPCDWQLFATPLTLPRTSQPL